MTPELDLCMRDYATVVPCPVKGRDRGLDHCHEKETPELTRVRNISIL